ncbi:Chromosome transmission fidelity protein 18 [Seiridium cupressi]
MLTASSPVVYPASSSPPPAKRPNPYRGQKPRARGKAGFLIDDDSDEEDALLGEPVAKRRMLSSPSEDVTAESTQPSSPPAQLEVEANESRKAKSQLRGTIETQGTIQDNLYGNVSVEQLFKSTSSLAPAIQKLASTQPSAAYCIRSTSGKTIDVKIRKATSVPSYEGMVAARSKTKEGRAKRAYYGIEIHELLDAAKQEMEASKATKDAAPGHPMPSIEAPVSKKSKKSLLWTEKYRARNFIDLCGDDGTNRHVLRWLKRWDPLVFPGASRYRPSGRRVQVEEEKPHRKILMLTGPPGLGKTTLAHVCARQAGYEVLEINASDDRSKDVVKNQIRTSLGTESVKTVQHKKTEPGQQPKVARPVCVVVDEVDGVVSGSGGSGDGGFIKALMDLITLGEKNSSGQAAQHTGRKQRKTDDFRQMRPLILICNDVYHPSLRPLRLSNLAEVIHVGKPTIDAVVNRLKSVFEKEGIPCEKDAARKLCESAWGMSSGMDAKKGAQSNAEGDLRGIMIVGEWVAGRLRSASLKGQLRLTRQWLDQHIVHELAHGGGGARGLGRGNTKDIVTRIFQEGAGFPKGTLFVAKTAAPLGEQPQAQLKFSEQTKKYAMERLREMVETSGDVDRVVTDIFSEYPSHELNDDFFLTKPNEAYEWMHFHDACSSRLFGSQDWELAPYISQPVLACHHLFATPTRHSLLMYQKRGQDEEEAPPLPFSGPRADFAAFEAERGNRAMLQAMQAQLSPTLGRSFRSVEDIATDFIPYLTRLVSPDVKPVVVGGSGDQKGTASVRKEAEKLMVKRAADTLLDVGISLQRGKIEGDAFSRPTWVYRMEPDIDQLSTFETSAAVVHGTQAPTRYAVRQVLDQEMHKAAILRENAVRQARFRAGNPADTEVFSFDNKEKSKPKLPLLPAIPVKKDFFGRVIKSEPKPLQETDGNGGKNSRAEDALPKEEQKVWVTFHEGMNNAVRKPISLDELLRGL